MVREKEFRIENLSGVFEEREKRIRRRIEQVLLSDISNCELLTILKEINDNWKDVFRPALTALSCEAVGGSPETTDDAGLMFALASAGFGIHDDIIDHSQNKHFRTTILGRHGLESTLIVGDLLVLKAWTIIYEMFRKNCPKTIETVVKEYGKLSVEICEAEFMENLCRKKLDTDLKTHENILWRAMAEIEACTRIGAILGNGNNDEVQKLAEFGRRLGFSYRLTDEVRDSLNIEGNLSHRLEYESMPLPILFAARSSKQRYLKIQSIIQKLPLSPTDIKKLLEICFESRAFEYILDIAKMNEKKINYTLSLLKPTNARDSLSLLSRQSFVNITDLIL